MAAALERALAKQRCDLLELEVTPSLSAPRCIAVPAALATYAVETARATDYDWLLEQGGLS